MTLNFSLTMQEANLVLNALGKMPYEIVFQLVEKLQQQANGQLQSENTTDETATAKSRAKPAKPAASL